MAIVSVNPATHEVIKRFESLTDHQLERKLALAAATFRTYRRTTFSQRARWMSRAAEILEAEADAFARLMTLEMGKTIRSARDEAVKCALGCRYYAENAERFLADQAVDDAPMESYVSYQPLGAVLAVMPWNFPFWQVFRFAAPALMAGNVGLLKHSSNVPQCGMAIEDIFRRAGFPEGAFQTLLIGSDKVRTIIDDPRIAAATLTGSEPAGSQVACQAGRRIKKTVLELGGSDPFIVMPSANLDEAVRTAVRARVVNNGQSCIAAKRFIIAKPIAERFQADFVRGMEALRVGDPFVDTTDVGPLATESMVTDLERQIAGLVKGGARVLTGGKRLDRAGNFFAPTVLSDVRPGTPAYYEELFGPVAMLLVAGDAEEAIRIANDSRFGLGASAWTNDPEEQRRFISELESGMVFINAMVASDPRLPFGGIKQSGYGRELGIFGIREFVNIKAVRMNVSNSS